METQETNRHPVLPFKVPNGYFDGLQGRILQQVALLPNPDVAKQPSGRPVFANLFRWKMSAAWLMIAFFGALCWQAWPQASPQKSAYRHAMAQVSRKQAMAYLQVHLPHAEELANEADFFHVATTDSAAMQYLLDGELPSQLD